MSCVKRNPYTNQLRFDTGFHEFRFSEGNQQVKDFKRQIDYRKNFNIDIEGMAMMPRADDVFAQAGAMENNFQAREQVEKEED